MTDPYDKLLAEYLIDGLDANNHQVIGTTMEVPEGGGYQVSIELGYGYTNDVANWTVQFRSKLGWLVAAEGAVREVLDLQISGPKRSK